MESDYRDRIVALLNDDSNEVGRVHLGIVHVFELESAAVAKRESAIVQPAFFTPHELRARRDTLETWSQLCVDRFNELLTPR